MEASTRIRYAVKNKTTGHIDLKYYPLPQVECQGLAKLFDVENYDIIARDFPTGLTDKNKVEIYGGDIYQNSKGGRAYVVYKNGCFCGGSEEEYGPLGWDSDLDGIDGIAEDSTEWTEIIGNIHQHPELLTTSPPSEDKTSESYTQKLYDLLSGHMQSGYDGEVLRGELESKVALMYGFESVRLYPVRDGNKVSIKVSDSPSRKLDESENKIIFEATNTKSNE